MANFDTYQKLPYSSFMAFKRYIYQRVSDDLNKKMVFIGGPRQVGKTTFAISLTDKQRYLNWDIDENRTAILNKEFGSPNLIIFDELHKYRRWRNYLKGISDSIQSKQRALTRILVTGSARLDLYRFGGDSLQGRYYYIRLMPLSYGELVSNNQEPDLLQSLFRYGGFPEPFFSQSELEHKRWAREYVARLVREDVRDLEKISDLGSLELLAGRLPELVGSTFSLNGLREDLRIAHKTAANWVSSLERMYYIFRITPFGPPKVKAVLKEPKLYLFDWALINDEGPRFENLMAVHLMKYTFWLQDSEGRSVELRYFRDRNGREVDFVLVEKNRPILLVECKRTDDVLSDSLRYLSAKYPGVPAYQVYLQGKKDFQTETGIRICPAEVLLKTLV